MSDLRDDVMKGRRDGGNLVRLTPLVPFLFSCQAPDLRATAKKLGYACVPANLVGKSASTPQAGVVIVRTESKLAGWQIQSNLGPSTNCLPLSLTPYP